MTVPAEIRAVTRPVNTVVVDSKSGGLLRYAVRERGKSVYVKGGNPKPRNGKTIGHIVNGKFVPLCKDGKLAVSGPHSLSYGGYALVHAVGADLLEDLIASFPIKDAYTIMAIAAIRTTHPRTSARRFSTEYHRGFVSRFYPGVGLSENTVSKFFDALGQDLGKRQHFNSLRLAAVCESHHVAIDGMLKANNSIANDLSAYSRKAKVKGQKDISILFAYDIERMEPVCTQVFPGNVIDAKAYRSFIETNHITEGIIVADKGFPPNEIKDQLQKNPKLHFLTPLKRNDRRIATHQMHQLTDVLKGFEEQVLCKKVQLEDGNFLYGFKDLDRERAEKGSFVSRALRKANFNSENYQKKESCFGTIVFLSDQDLSCEAVYKCYSERWFLELVFDQYKNELGLDSTHVQGDFSVHGAEFVNFISTILSCRIVNLASKTGLLDKMTYGELLDDLNHAWRKTDASINIKPSSDDEQWVNVTNKILSILEALELSTPIPKPLPAKRGRPRKEKPSQEEFVGPKRPRGRPRKKKEAAVAQPL